MDSNRIHEIIQDIRRGREEDGSLEWKRAFWRLDNDDSRREFLKDIAAMANSTDTPKVRRIILGIKGARLYPCKIPEDEAHLQQRLSAITPQPVVCFRTCEIESTSLVVVEIHPPFDRPYVAKLSSDHFIWVRNGSSIGTASRYHLDAFYRENPDRPALSLRWIDEDKNEISVLELPAPPSVDLTTVKETLQSARPTKRDLKTGRPRI